jgi:hypothetical protein
MNTPLSDFVRRFLFLMAAACILAAPATAFADGGLLVVVAERVAGAADESVDFWWNNEASPSWTATDVALREAMRAEGAGFAEPRSLSELSRIYRVPELSDASAAAMASVFGHRRVLVGTVVYEPASLSPVGLTGWRATVALRLLERSAEGTAIRQEVSFERAIWGREPEDALADLRGDVARQVARSVAGGLQRKVGPVGVDSEELLIALRSAKTRAYVDAVIDRLETFAGVSDVTFRWAAEGQIVLEVNPGELDPESSVRQYASLLMAEEFDGFRLASGEPTAPSVVVFSVEEQVP